MEFPHSQSSLYSTQSPAGQLCENSKLYESTPTAEKPATSRNQLYTSLPNTLYVPIRDSGSALYTVTPLEEQSTPISSHLYTPILAPNSEQPALNTPLIRTSSQRLPRYTIDVTKLEEVPSHLATSFKSRET